MMDQKNLTRNLIQSDESSKTFSVTDAYSNSELKTCGKTAQTPLKRLEDWADGLDPLRKDEYQGEEFECKSQSSPIHTQADSWDGHNPDASRSKDVIEDKYQSQVNFDDQYSDHNCYPFEMIVLKSEVVLEDEQQVGIVEGEQVKKEEENRETFKDNESRETDSSCRFAIEEENVEGVEELNSTHQYRSPTTNTRIQEVPPEVNAANCNFVGENKCIVMKSQCSSFELIGGQKSSNSYIYDNNSPGQSPSLNTHLKEPHSCELCNKSFDQKSHLTTHLLTHTREKTIMHAGKNHSFVKFVKNHSLVNQGSSYMNVHMLEKNHSCVIFVKNHSFRNTFSPIIY